MAIDHQAPDVLAMVIADAVLRDLVSGKNFIQGTYSAIFAAEFPLIFPAIVVYVAITNGHGQTELELRLVDVDEEREPVFVAKMMVHFPDPLGVAECVFAHRQVIFPGPGEYRLQLFGAGQPLRERRLQVLPPPTPTSE